MFELPSSSKLNIRSFSQMLEYSTQSASYKPLWLRGILEEVKKGNQEISFKAIGCHMVSRAWYPILHCKLSFGVQDSLPKLVQRLSEMTSIKPDEGVEVIQKKLLEMDDKLLDIKILFDQVPYRILSAFYKVDSKGFNKNMREATSNDEMAFYQFIEDGKKIRINDLWFEYLYENQVIIQAWIENSFIYYLQKKNPNVPAIPFKLNPPEKRNLGDATKLWNYYAVSHPLTDIYINKELDIHNIGEHGSLSIDHFIPWSFVLHDEMWNLLPSFKNVNSSKNNSLPDLNVYFKDFCNLQYDLFDFMRTGVHEGKQQGLVRKLLEDYLSIIPTEHGVQKGIYEISPDRFKDYLYKTITPLYQIAYNQGYNIWIYKNREVNYNQEADKLKDKMSSYKGFLVAEE